MALSLSRDIAFNRYLNNNNVRGGFRSSRGRKRGRKSAGLKKSHANVSSRVPTRSIMQGAFNGSIRNYFTVEAAASYYKTFTLSDLIGDAYASLAAQFVEARVNAARLYFYPNPGTNSSQLYAASLFDSSGETSITTGLTFGKILASPGSTCRKIYQSSGFHWKWTEPSDAEYLRISATGNKLFIFQLATNSGNISGDLIVDASIILRNQSGSVAKSIVSHLDQLSGKFISADDWLAIFSSVRLLRARVSSNLCNTQPSIDDSLEQLSLEDLEDLENLDLKINPEIETTDPRRTADD